MSRCIDIFGDSIMKGIVLADGRYHPMETTYFDRFAERFQVTINNCSHFGYTVRKGAVLLQRALSRGRTSGVVVLEYGGNDCDFDWKAVAKAPQGDHQPNVPPDEFCALYADMVRKLQSTGAAVVLMTLPPIDAERYLRWVAPDEADRRSILRWLGDVQIIYRFQEMYSGLVSRVAAETGALLADVRPSFLQRHDAPSLICSDGIHPNEAGHRVIYEALCAFAERCLPKVLDNPRFA